MARIQLCPKRLLYFHKLTGVGHTAAVGHEYITVGPTIVINVFLLRHQLWMPICLKIILFLLHCSEKRTFLLSFIYTCDIIWPPAPFESCYLARNLKEVARACTSSSAWRQAQAALSLSIYDAPK